MQVEKPHWRTKPKYISLRVDPRRIKRSPLGNEVSIVLRAGDKEHTVVVPASAVDESNWTLGAAEVGEHGGLVLLSFPPTTMGTATWPVSRRELGQLLAASGE